jgi:nucleoprotein TPR
MHDDQLANQSREVQNLTVRHMETYNLYTRADIERNRLSEDLIAANALVEQLRNDCANLRAEKRIADDIQARLTQENKNLQLERSHLSSLMANVQQIHNDLQKSGDNDRRRLETQIQLLERQR